MTTPCAHGALTAPSCTSLHTWVGIEITGIYQFCLHVNFSHVLLLLLAPVNAAAFQVCMCDVLQHDSVCC